MSAFDSDSGFPPTLRPTVTSGAGALKAVIVTFVYSDSEESTLGRWPHYHSVDIYKNRNEKVFKNPFSS